jgi:hypothetical protein
VPSRPAPASQGDPAQAIEVQIRRFPVFDALDAKAIAVQHAGRMMTSTQKLPHVLAAIESCAAKSVGLGLKTEPLQSKLIGFLWNARAPVNQEREPSKVIESPDDSPESLSTAREAAERKRTKAEAEAKRRAGLEAERKKNA